MTLIELKSQPWEPRGHKANFDGQSFFPADYKRIVNVPNQYQMTKSFAQTMFGRRSASMATEQERALEAKKTKEQGLVAEFPAEEDIEGDVVLELLMMNG